MSEVEVKALEWKDEPDGEYIAQSVIGWFHIGRPASYWNLTTPHGLVSSYETLEDAKAAAQSDFDARIRSALVERKAEPVKKGWRVFENIFRGEWGIEDLGDPDGDAILPPKRIDREHLDRIVSAYNAALSASPSPVGESRDGLIERLSEALIELADYVKHHHFHSDREKAKAMVAKAHLALAAKEKQP